MLDDIMLKIEPLIDKCAKELSFEVIEINIKRQNRNIVIDVVSDKEHGGITIDECTLLNKTIGNHIEENELIEEPYVVEVSSPGCDRPLTTANDFRRNIGREIEIYLKDAIENTKTLTGLIDSVTGDSVTIKRGLEEKVISLTNIEKAIQVLPL